MSEDSTISLILVLVFIVGIILGITIRGDRLNKKWRQDSIKQGYAEYNQTNGKWQWKNKETTK